MRFSQNDKMDNGFATIFFQDLEENTCSLQPVLKNTAAPGFLKSFGLTRPGNRVQVYRLRGGRSNHAP